MFKHLAAALLIALAGAQAPAFAQQADDLVRQLLPADAPQDAGSSSVMELKLANSEEILKRLTLPLTATRSINGKINPPRRIVIGQGREAETLASLHSFQSLQVAVAFQGSSDALSPEAGPLLAALGQALNDPKLQPYRFIVGVHPKSVGSDGY